MIDFNDTAVPTGNQPRIVSDAEREEPRAFRSGDAGCELLLDGARTQQQQQRPAACGRRSRQLRPENGPVRRYLLRDDSNVV